MLSCQYPTTIKQTLRGESMGNYITVLHECTEFSHWKKAFDADASARKAAGLTTLHVMREHSNPNLLALMFEASDVSRARAFAQSPQLAERMRQAGIIGTPRIRFRHGAYTRSTADGFASMTLDVRNFDTARKAYATDAADRKQAGLTDLALLQSVDDPNNLLILWAAADVARATAFFDSPALAAHMANNAGVVGKPERHFWKPA
jgi:hypothetical protein